MKNSGYFEYSSNDFGILCVPLTVPSLSQSPPASPWPSRLPPSASCPSSPASLTLVAVASAEIV